MIKISIIIHESYIKSFILVRVCTHLLWPHEKDLIKSKWSKHSQSFWGLSKDKSQKTVDEHAFSCKWEGFRSSLNKWVHALFKRVLVCIDFIWNIFLTMQLKQWKFMFLRFIKNLDMQKLKLNIALVAKVKGFAVV